MFKKIVYYFNPYRIYYRAYYYLIGIDVIEHPKPANPPKNAVPCKAELHPKACKHHNFLYAPVKPNKWLFWRRKFAFRLTGTHQWYCLPKLTPWNTDENGVTKFGLNFTFVKKWKDCEWELEFITWI